MAAPKGPKKVHRYTVEFKVQAVRLSLHPEIQTQDVVQALDRESVEKDKRREFCVGAGAHTHFMDDSAPQIAKELDRLVG